MYWYFIQEKIYIRRTYRLVSGKICTLGLVITENDLDNYNLDFKDKIIKLGKLLNMWKGRNLSMFEKAIIVNNLAL
jgi:hypothetical protein